MYREINRSEFLKAYQEHLTKSCLSRFIGIPPGKKRLRRE